MRFAWVSIALSILLAAAGAGAEEPPARLVIEAPARATSGARIEAAIKLSPLEENVIGWSIAVACEGLPALDAAAAGTDFDRFSDGGYAETGLAPDGTAVYSIAVLSFLEPVALPAGTWSVLRTAHLVSRKDPGTATLAFLEHLRLPGDDREIRNEVLISESGIAPISGEPVAIEVAGCADFLLAAAQGGSSPISVDVGTAIEIEAAVRVASSLHSSPSGFTLAVAHDSNVIGLESAAITAVAESLAEAGGFARIETSEEGWKATVVPPVTDPKTLGPGDHVVARARYIYAGSSPPGAGVSTSVSVSDGAGPASLAPGSAFQPGDALPCSHASLRLDLTVVPRPWARGDGNSDGVIDLADGVALLIHLFRGGTAPCLRAMETNSDGMVDLADAVFLLNHLFAGGPALAAPFPECGAAGSALPCDETACAAE